MTESAKPEALRFISVDDHVQEHPRVWTDRLSRAKWGDRIPHVERQPDGLECWVVDGERLPLRGVGLAGACMPDRAMEPQRWEEVPRIAYDAKERLRAMDLDGVNYSVLYPTVAGLAGEVFGRVKDPEFELACVQAYNDWIIEEWASVSPRFIPQSIVPISSIEVTVEEIKRAMAKGHRGVIYPAVPMHLRDVPHINEPEYDLVWATCEELGVPLCFHAGASVRIQLPAFDGFSPALAAAVEAITRPASTILVMTNLLFSRILLRHPKLKVIFSESSLGWGAYLLEFADQQFDSDRVYLEGYDLKPSEMFKRQCYLTGWYDQAGVRARHYVGPDNMMWATNFPLATSTWPQSRDYVTRSFQNVAETERHKILWENAAGLYGI